MTALKSKSSFPLSADFLQSSLSIKDLSSILNSINPENVNIHPTIFTTPLYNNTVLERHDVIQSSAVILRKNLYFLAKKTVDVFSFIIQLVQMGLLHLDDREKILKMESETMKALECYIMIVQSNHSFDKLLHVLRITNNTEILGILELRRAQEKSKPELPATSSGLQKEKEAEKDMPHLPLLTKCMTQQLQEFRVSVKLENGWSCKRCTFQNGNEMENCGVCDSAKNADPNELEGSNKCPQCTLVNFPEVMSCEACGFIFRDVEAERLLDYEVAIRLQNEEDSWDT